MGANVIPAHDPSIPEEDCDDTPECMDPILAYDLMVKGDITCATDCPKQSSSTVGPTAIVTPAPTDTFEPTSSPTWYPTMAPTVDDTQCDSSMTLEDSPYECYDMVSLVDVEAR